MTTIEIKGLKEMQAAFKRNPKVTAEQLNIALKKAILIIQSRARQEAPVDKSFLRGAAMITRFGFLQAELENVAPYAVYVHDGTKPHFPPIAAVQGWADRHGIPAFLVARSISRKGTKGVPFFDIAIEKTGNQVDNVFDKAIDLIHIDLAK